MCWDIIDDMFSNECFSKVGIFQPLMERLGFYTATESINFLGAVNGSGSCGRGGPRGHLILGEKRPVLGNPCNESWDQSFKKERPLNNDITTGRDSSLSHLP